MRPKATINCWLNNADREGQELEFADLIRSERQKRFETSRQCHQELDLPCSYFYYTKIEKGEKHPDVDLAISILERMNINLRQGLYAWVRGLMPTSKTKAMFTELNDVPERSAEQMSANRSLVVNRMQAQLLKKDPVYWETILCISCHYGFKKFTAEQLAKQFKYTYKKMKSILTDLYDYGIVDREGDYYITKEWIYIPYGEEYQELREMNFQRAVEKFYKKPEKSRYRTTITRLISKEQKEAVESYIEALQNSIIDLPDQDGPNSYPITVGVFAAERGFGDA